MKLSTISFSQKKLPEIGDSWSGKPNLSFHWIVQSGALQGGWMSSLDYRSHREPMFMTDSGAVDQGASIWVDESGYRSSQRPALFSCLR